MRGHRARRSVSAVILLVLAATAPAGARGSSGTADPAQIDAVRAQAPAGAMGARITPEGTDLRSGFASMPELLTRTGDPRSPAALLTLAHEAIQQRSRMPIPKPIALDPLSGVNPVDRSHLTGQTWRVGVPAGDLDADGLQDTLLFELVETDEGGELSVDAARGTDATVLWSRELGDAFGAIPVPVGDLNADGSDDLFLLGLVVHEQTDRGGCVPLAACAIDYGLTYDWELSVLSGSDGSTIMERSYPGTYGVTLVSDASLLPTYAFAVRFYGEAVALIPFLGGDHDADGSPDLVVNVLDLDALIAFGGGGASFVFVDGEVYSYRSQTQAEIISADGTTIMTMTAEDGWAESILLPAGDAVGDGTTDLVWLEASLPPQAGACVWTLVLACRSVSLPAGLSLQMLDGATLAPAWERVVSTGALFAFVDTIGVDLTGDDRAEVVLIELDSDYFAHQTVLSGIDGTPVWNKQHDFGLIPGGSIGGGPGQDLLTIDYDFLTGEIGLVRFDGATGDLLLRTVAPLPSGSYLDIVLFLLGDADADGVQDYAIDTIVFDTDPPVSDATIESGATGASIYARTLPTFGYVLPARDLDGDGADDLLDLTVTVTTDGLELATDAVMLPSGTTAWSDTIATEPELYLDLWPSPDMDGSGGGELLMSRTQVVPTPAIESNVTALAGDGTTLWQVGLPLSPPVPKGSIAGTVTDEVTGDPLAEACVVVFDTVGNDLFWGYTSTGAYQVNWLLPGDYVVGFSDCGWEEYQTEYYDDHDSFEDADLVGVVGGGVTSGIDAALTPLV